MRPRSAGRRANAAGAAVLVLGGGLAATAVGFGRPSHRPATSPRGLQDAKRLFAATAVLAASVLADSGLQHYRGGYRNPGMLTPLVVGGATLTAALKARGGERLGGAPWVFGTAVTVGGAGVAFHLHNLRNRPGSFNWANLFYAAPLGAPAALSLAGVLGLAGFTVESGRRRLLGLSLSRCVMGVAALGLAGTAGEAGLLHYRGSFQNPLMWLPVTVPPIGAALLGRAAVERRVPERRPLTRGWLVTTALLGLGGVGLHILGVSRAMGGWRNWRQNLIAGPPIPAPPAFAAMAIAGLAALDLRDREAA